MNIFSFAAIIRLILSLVIGFIISSKLKDFITTRVIRNMPQKYRVTDDFFHLQARISMLFSFTIALGISFFLNMGMIKTSHFLFGEPKTPQKKEVEVVSPKIQKNPKVQHPKKEDTNPSDENDYYLQMEAFGTLAKAKELQEQLFLKFPEAVFIGYQKGKSPYKVLIGPFESLDLAKAFKNKRNLDGFPRKKETIRKIAQ
jgi:hypothetical protein